MARSSENITDGLVTVDLYGKLGTNMHGGLAHNHHESVPNHNIDQIVRSSPMPLSRGLIPAIKDIKHIRVKKSCTQYRRELTKRLLKRSSRLVSQQVSQLSASSITKIISQNDRKERCH